MKIKLVITFLFTCICFVNAQKNRKSENLKANTAIDIKYEANWKSLSNHNKTPEWFKDSKLGIYFHWGVYSVPAYGGEWYPHWMYLHKESGWGSGWKEYHEKTYGSDFNYHEFIPDFTGEHFDAEEWAKLFKATGAKFGGPVAQHHDGFSMWDSEINPWNAMDMGPKKDIVGEMLKALEKEGLKTITTFHHAFTYQDEKNPSYYNNSPEYATGSLDSNLQKLYGNMPLEEGREFWLNLTNEVVDNYSPDLIWFDSDLHHMPTSYIKKMASHFFNASNIGQKETGIISKHLELPANIRIHDIERGGMKEMPKDFWMTDITISRKLNGWSYINGQKYKSVDVILKNMIDTWSKKGIVLLNVSPTAKGIINNEQRSIMKEIGNWIKVHEEAIYNTRTHTIYGYGNAEIEEGSHGGQSSTIEFSEKDIRFTCSKDRKTIFVFLLGQSKEGKQIHIKHILDGFEGQKVKKISLVGSKQKVKWKFNGDLIIKGPKATSYNKIATVFKVVLK